MATGNIQQVDTLSNITNLLSTFKGTKSSQTTKSNISSEGMNALIQQILGSAQGLASVAGGQKSAGLYNSSTNQLLLNDLITRTAGELAKQKAGTTTTTTTAPKLGGQDILQLLVMQGGSKLLGPTIKGFAKKGEGLGDQLANALGIGAESGAADSMVIDTAGQGIADIGASSIGAQAIESLASEGLASAAADTAESEGGNAIVDFFSSLFGG